MLALVRYWLAVLLHSQRYFPPLVLFVVGVVVLTSNDGGPLTSAYGSCSAVSFLSALWLTVALIQVDDPVQRAITVVNARSSARVLIAAVLVAVGVSAVCVAFGLFYPLVSGTHKTSVLSVLVGAVSQMSAALLGIAAGLICSRLVVSRPAVSLAFAIVLAIVGYVFQWASPLNPLLRVMASDRTPIQLLVPVSGLAALSAVMLIAAGALTQFVAVRRA